MHIIELREKLSTLAIRTVAECFPEAADSLDASAHKLFSIPEKAEFGLFSTNIALQLQKKLEKKKSPLAVAETLAGSIAEHIKNDAALRRLIGKVEIASIGFINFFASDEFYKETATVILEAPDAWGLHTLHTGKQILIEFTDPNPFKEFHIGHLMSNCIGESLARLYEYAGARVSRLCYQGDVGMHVAKTIWAWQRDLTGQKHIPDKLRALPHAERIKLLGQWYAEGSKAYIDDASETKQEIERLNTLIFRRTNKTINALYDTGKQWSLEAFELIYKKLGTRFEKYYFESETGIVGETLVRKHIGTVFIESEGAVIFPGEAHGLHNRVFINSQGLPTYEAKELGLALKKTEDFTYDRSIVVTGNEINDYFKVLFCAIEKIRPDIATKTFHVGHGMLRLPEGKMSSRTGNVVTGEGLIRLVAEKIREESEAPEDWLLDVLAVGAIKFALLKQHIGKDVIFSLKESVSFHGASGVYLEYTHARASSLLEKAEHTAEKPSLPTPINPEISPLYRHISILPCILEEACLAHSPSLVANYLISLAQLYNTYYSAHRVIGTEREDEGLVLTAAVKATLAAGLKALGITPVEKM